MKKLLLATAFMAVTAAPAMAQVTDDATLDMSAAVSERCEVNLVGTNPNILFTLDQTVANIDFVCNIPGDVGIRFTSANSGEFVNAGNGDSVAYTVDFLPNNVPNGDISGVGDNLSIAAPIDAFAVAGALLSGAQVDLRVNVDQNNNNGDGLYAGDYDDTITIEMGPLGTF